MKINRLDSDVWIIDDTCYCPTCIMSRELKTKPNKNVYIKWIYFLLVKVERIELVLNKSLADVDIEQINTYSINELHKIIVDLYDTLEAYETDLEYTFKYDKS